MAQAGERGDLLEAVFVEVQRLEVGALGQRREVGDLVAVEVERFELGQCRERRDVVDVVVVKPQLAQLGAAREQLEIVGVDVFAGESEAGDFFQVGRSELAFGFLGGDAEQERGRTARPMN